MNELELLPSFCSKNNIQLTAHSFLSFGSVSFQIENHFEIVFFASPRAAHFFTARVNCSDKLIAVAGESTRKFVEKIGLSVHFSPKNSGNISESSLEFARWATNKKVLFPTSDRSQKSYTKQLKSEQFETVLVYKTHISTEKIEINDFYVFTSPSNVDGFIASNSFPSGANIVAWGETTYNELLKYVPQQQLRFIDQSSEEKLLCLLK